MWPKQYLHAFDNDDRGGDDDEEDDDDDDNGEDGEKFTCSKPTSSCTPPSLAFSGSMNT